jgi:hypothetical protein
MPSLRDAIQSAKNMSNYVPVPGAPMAVSVQPPTPSPNANMRFILPSFNQDPDSIRLAESNTPKIRIWPRPQQTAGAATATTAASTSSSSSSSSSTAALASATATVTTATLLTSFSGSVVMAESFQLLSISVNRACEVRLYGTPTAQSIDAYRATDAPVPPETTAGIIACVTFDTAPYTWGFQNVCGANQLNPQSNLLYVSVINTNPLIQTPVTVTIQFVPMES